VQSVCSSMKQSVGLGGQFQGTDRNDPWDNLWGDLKPGFVVRREWIPLISVRAYELVQLGLAKAGLGPGGEPPTSPGNKTGTGGGMGCVQMKGKPLTSVGLKLGEKWRGPRWGTLHKLANYAHVRCSRCVEAKVAGPCGMRSVKQTCATTSCYSFFILFIVDWKSPKKPGACWPT